MKATVYLLKSLLKMTKRGFTMQMSDPGRWRNRPCTVHYIKTVSCFMKTNGRK